MRNLLFPTIALINLMTAPPLRSQGWDAIRHATGWACQDVDGSFLFFDPASQTIRNWAKGSGLLTTHPLALAPVQQAVSMGAGGAVAPQSTLSDYDAAAAILYGIPKQQNTRGRQATATLPSSKNANAVMPDRWVVDSFNRVWIVLGRRLAILGRNGVPETMFTLPATVEEIALARDGIVLLYRTAEPYVEKRDLKTGALLWAFGDESQARESMAQPLRVPLNCMSLGLDGTVYVGEGASLTFTVLDPIKGPKVPGQVFFTWNGKVPAPVRLGALGRGPMVSWAGKEVIFGVFSPGQVRMAGAPESKGLILARFDLANGTLDWQPTSLSEGHRLVGLLDTEAVFVAPHGGLVFAPIH